MCVCVVCTQSQFTCQNFLCPSEMGLFSTRRTVNVQKKFYQRNFKRTKLGLRGSEQWE